MGNCKTTLDTFKIDEDIGDGDSNVESSVFLSPVNMEMHPSTEEVS